MDVLTAILSSLLPDCVKCTLKSLKRVAHYVFDHESIMQGVTTQFGKLEAERDSVNVHLEASRRDVKEVTDPIIQKWLTSVGKKISADAKKMKQDEDKANKRCFIGFCPNCWSRYKLSKRAEEEEMKAINELLEEAQRFHKPEIAYRPNPQSIATRPINGYVPFGSRTRLLEEIMEAFKDPEVTMIGLHGLGGVGKTMLTEEIFRKARKEHLFDEVVKVTIKYDPKVQGEDAISFEPNIKAVQGEIADQLGVRVDQETEEGRAMWLRWRLKKHDKRILVIVDDIRTRINLESVGISVENDQDITSKEKAGTLMKTVSSNAVQAISPNAFHKCSTFRSKILLTSKSRDVLHYYANKKDIFEVTNLSHEEGMILFENIVGDIIQKPSYRSIADEMVRKCGALPVAISVIAEALKDKKLRFWEDALRQLRSSNPKNIDGIQESVYSTLELSYKLLTSKEAQTLFLLCGLEPPGYDISITDLLKYGLGWDLLEDINTMEEARKSMSTLVHKLKSSSLLLGTDDDEQVKMHEIVRDVSINIASKDKQMYVVKYEAQMKQLLKKGKLKNCTALSLPFSNIHKLPDLLDCPKLELFMLLSKDSSLELQDTFFKEMSELKVLDLTGMRISKLPSSFPSLTNLQTLCLDHCVLHDIADVGELKNLEILSFFGSDIEQLPPEIMHLTNLKLLDLSHCTKLKVIPIKLIPCLSCLEELHMGNSFDRWDFEGNVRLTELKCLSRLTALDLHIRDDQKNNIPRDLFSGNLERYKIFIGDVWDWSGKFKTTKMLKLKLQTSIHLYDGVKALLKTTEDLHLDELQGVKNVLYELDDTGFSYVKNLYIQNSSEIQYIINSVEKAQARRAFPKLKSMFLCRLIKLQKICHGKLNALSLARLRTIKVKTCSQLKNLFSFSIVTRLPQLQEIEVTDCNNMTEIVVEDRQEEINEGEAHEKLEFRQLQSLALDSLPELLRFYSTEQSQSTFEPGQAQLMNDTMLRPVSFFNEKVAFPCLEDLQLSSLTVGRIWHNHHSVISYCIQNLTSLIIADCGNLVHLFSSSIANGLVQLRRLEVAKCETMRVVTITEAADIEVKDRIVFSKLNSLKIKDLENLIGFCSGKYSIEFPSLKLLEIINCPELEGFSMNTEPQAIYSNENGFLGLQPLFNAKVAFPSLETMVVSQLNKVNMIWDRQLPAGSFCKLKKLQLEYCDKLLTLFPSSLVGTFQGLETLTVTDNGSIEEIFELKGLNKNETHVVKTQLRELYIIRLPKLKHVWNNDPMGTLSFQNLHLVFAQNCWRLENLFPASVARDLLNLEELIMDSCAVEEIVSMEEGPAKTARFKFPQLSSLTLWDLPSLKCFYPGRHEIMWPELKKLKAYRCGQVKMFPTELLSMQETDEEDQLENPTPQSLFLVEEVFSKLEEVSLNSDDIAMICNSQFPAEIFHSIKLLRVLCFHDESVIFPFNFLQRFNNLESLDVSCCYFKELFSFEGLVLENQHIEILKRIRRLKLDFLPHLTYIWKDSQLHPVLQNLVALEVWQCDELIKLAPFSVSFQNLTEIHVFKCRSIIHLLTASTAQSLAQLINLSIRECTMVTNVVSNEEQATYEIIFKELKYLELHCLPSLTSFCSGKYAFRFPSLEEVIVRQCPNLNIFCAGDLSTPRVQRVQTNGENKWHWEGGLNTTIHQLYIEKVGYHGLEYLVLSKHPNLINTWNKNIQENLDFQNLKFFEVCNCSSLEYLFTPSIALCLTQLQCLEVKNCDAMEQVITNGVEEVATYKIIFPQLKSVVLKSCINLTSFCLGNYTVECPILKEVLVGDCPSAVTFASKVSIEQEKRTTSETSKEGHGKGDPDHFATFFSDEIVFPNLEELRLSSINIQKLWHDGLVAVPSCVQNLTSLIVESCGSLKYVLSSSMVKNFVQLRTFEIHDCKRMEGVIFPDGLAEHTVGNMFPNLEFLALKDLPILTSFCSGKLADFPFLRELYIENCPVLTFVSDSSSEGTEVMGQTQWNNSEKNFGVDITALFDDRVEFPRLLKLGIFHMKSLERIWHVPLALDSFCKLNHLTVGFCDKLLSVFPLSMLGKLRRLDILDIYNCSSLKQIFESLEENAGEKHYVFFPKMTYLSLCGLLSLNAFHPTIHSAQWPSLKKIEVIQCDKVEIFASECLNLHETCGEGQPEIPNQQPLFWVNKITFPRLEELRLEGNDNMKEIWHGNLPSECFINLKVLKLVSFPKQSTIRPSHFSLSLLNLENLVVSDASFSEIFLSGPGANEEHACGLTQLSELTLSEFRELRHLWEEEIQSGPYFQKLRILEVSECCKLKTLVPASVSFRNLMTLNVSRCHALVNLMTKETAKTLEQLTRMYVTDCQMIKEIIASMGDEAEDGIVFTQLKYLKLACLPNITSFCSGNYTFGFPLLEEVIVRQCQKMKIFCRRELSTPILQRVQLEDEGNWKGNLKTAMQQLFIGSKSHISEEE